MPAPPHFAASKLVLLAVFFAALVLLAAYFAAMNWWGFFANVRNRHRGIHKHYSPAPFLSAVVAISVSIAARNWPFFRVARWILIIPALDIGNWQVLISLAMLGTRRSGKNKEASP